MVCVISPVDQRYDEAALVVSVTLPPAQNVVEPPAEIVAVGYALTVIRTDRLVIVPHHGVPPSFATIL